MMEGSDEPDTNPAASLEQKKANSE